MEIESSLDITQLYNVIINGFEVLAGTIYCKSRWN